MVLNVIEVVGTRLVGEIGLTSMCWPYLNLCNCLSHVFYRGAASKLSCLNRSMHCLVQNN